MAEAVRDETGAGFERAAEGIKGAVQWLPRRLSEMGWVKGSGLVEEGKGNVIVWGAPDVERLGKVQDAGVQSGGRLV
jgi:cytochrome c oxidase assembly factor 3